MIGPSMTGPGLFDLHFNLRILEFLADHRNPALTLFFTTMSGFGDGRWYVLVVLAIYVAWDKQLAVRLSILMTLAGSFNNILKTLIGNPRPFVREGTYRHRWAIPARNAAALAGEYSTPSGHAMSAGSFYSFLGGSVRDRQLSIAAVGLVLLVGVSRPYLGVHYVEDVLLGWALGLGIGLLSLRCADAITDAWSRLAYGVQIGAALAVSAMLCVIAMAVNHWRIDGGSMSLLSDAGMFTGVVIARPLELRFVNFDPMSSSASFKVLRLLLTLGLAAGVVDVSGRALHLPGGDLSMGGSGLQFARYAVAGVVSLFAAPWVFTRIGLAERMAQKLTEGSHAPAGSL